MKKSFKIWVLVLLILQACSTNEDAQPLCIAPPGCGEIIPNQVSFTIFNSTDLSILEYSVIKTESDFESVKLQPTLMEEVSCWYNFSRSDVTSIKITLGESEDDQNTIELSLDLSQTINVEDGGIYWIDLNQADNTYTISITAYDPTVCKDTEDS